MDEGEREGDAADWSKIDAFADWSASIVLAEIDDTSPKIDTADVEAAAPPPLPKILLLPMPMLSDDSFGAGGAIFWTR